MRIVLNAERLTSRSYGQEGHSVRSGAPLDLLAQKAMNESMKKATISDADVEHRRIERRTFLGRFGVAAGLVGLTGLVQGCGGAASDGAAASDTDAAASDTDAAASDTEAAASDTDAAANESSDSDSSDEESSDSDSSDSEGN